MRKGVERGKDEDLSSLSEKENWRLYSLPGVRYCDKGNHKESSLYHAPQHREHWRKVERKRRSGQLIEDD